MRGVRSDIYNLVTFQRYFQAAERLANTAKSVDLMK